MDIIDMIKMNAKYINFSRGGNRKFTFFERQTSGTYDSKRLA